MNSKILILASKSPRRIYLLKKNKIKFKVSPSKIKEKTSFKKPFLIVKEIAYKKALHKAIKNPNSPILAADTLVYCKKQILGKPKNSKDALKKLKLQNGSSQIVYTGVSLIWLSKKIFLCDYEKSICWARKLSEEELLEMSFKHLDKAGGWAVQDKNDYFIRKISGRFDNVIGLPMNLVKRFLKKIKYDKIYKSKA